MREDENARPDLFFHGLAPGKPRLARWSQVLCGSGLETDHAGVLMSARSQGDTCVAAGCTVSVRYTMGAVLGGCGDCAFGAWCRTRTGGVF